VRKSSSSASETDADDEELDKLLTVQQVLLYCSYISIYIYLCMYVALFLSK